MISHVVLEMEADSAWHGCWEKQWLGTQGPGRGCPRTERKPPLSRHCALLQAMMAQRQSQLQNHGLSLLLCWLSHQTTIALLDTKGMGELEEMLLTPENKSVNGKSACLTLVFARAFQQPEKVKVTGS